MVTEIPFYFKIHTNGEANPEAIVRMQGVRFTVLTSRLVRIEYSSEEKFEDRPSQIFWFRQHPAPVFSVLREGDRIEIETEHIHLRYHQNNSSAPFTSENLTIVIKKNNGSWEYGMEDSKNLGGTLRTLDTVDGSHPLEPGLISRSGWCVVNDTQSLVFNERGWLEARTRSEDYEDLYFFGYGTDYQGCTQDYFKIAGKPGFVPRWALGNWWSRYWEYSDGELRELLLDFRKHEIPLSVCIIDMDWHITKTGNQSSGWTGYTWNKNLFPKPKETVDFIHDLDLKTGLNLHPAAGIHPHEEMYAQMADAMGIDPSSEEPVQFEIENPDFVVPYFKYLHHTQEEQVGIDFWWMDWQQGNPSSLPGLNLLWWINHLHYYDSRREKEKRPFLFSRWGGLGNHRYPIGFSGDTVISWDSLGFQPYLTATAANVGFGWWSHDIGGHMEGITDAELYTRWVQLGVFSPILRLHSTKNPFLERRPWGYDHNTYIVVKEAMQLRHALVAYIYSMARRDNEKGIPLIQPMYYEFPDLEQAYACPNQYTFGSELMAAPYITPMEPDLKLARQVLWLPKGEWYDFFSGDRMSVKEDGGFWKVKYGEMRDIPVFAKAGAIIPTGKQGERGGVKLPQELTVRIFPGADNTFELYEDDGSTSNYLAAAYAISRFSQEWTSDNGSASLKFTIHPVEGDRSIIPPNRQMELDFVAVGEPLELIYTVNGKQGTNPPRYTTDEDGFHITGFQVNPDDLVLIELSGFKLHDNSLDDTNRKSKEFLRLLNAMRLNNDVKTVLQLKSQEIINDYRQLIPFKMALTPVQLRTFLEILTDSGMDFIGNTGQDRLIIWNNREDPDFTWLFTAEQAAWRNPENWFHNEQGVSPKFRTIVPEKDLETVIRGRKRYFTGMVQINYQNLLRGEIIFNPREKKVKNGIGWR